MISTEEQIRLNKEFLREFEGYHEFEDKPDGVYIKLQSKYYNNTIYGLTTEIEIKFYNINKIRRLIEAGADVNIELERGDMPLHWTAKNNHLELAQLLISSGVDLEAEDDESYKPLYWAIEYNSLEVAKLLISSGVDLEAKDSWGSTPLHWAAGMNNRLEIAQFLISSGADVNVKDEWGQTPFRFTVSQKMRELLIKHGATR